MNARQTIENLVGDMISKGLISQDQKDSYVSQLAANDQMAEYFAGQMLRQADYTKKTMELANHRREFDNQRQQELARVEQERAQLVQWERDTRAEIERLRSLEGTAFSQTDRLARMEQVLRDYNLLDQIPDTPSTTPYAASATTSSTTPLVSTQKEVPMSDNGNWLSREEASQALQDVIRLNSIAMRIGGLHQQLFGQPLTDDIITEALQSNIPPAQLESYWRTKYAVDAREATLRDQKEQADREALKAELRKEMLSEFATDPSRVLTGNPSAPRPVGSVLEQYAASRAAAVNPLGDGTQAPLAPERRPELQLHASRLNDATTYFRENFSPDGTPLKGDSRLTS